MTKQSWVEPLIWVRSAHEFVRLDLAAAAGGGNWETGMASNSRQLEAPALERLRRYEKENKALVEQQDDFIERLERRGRPTDEARGLLQQLMFSLQLVRASVLALEQGDVGDSSLAGSTAGQAMRGEANVQPGADLFTFYRVW